MKNLQFDTFLCKIYGIVAEIYANTPDIALARFIFPPPFVILFTIYFGWRVSRLHYYFSVAKATLEPQMSVCLSVRPSVCLLQKPLSLPELLLLTNEPIDLSSLSTIDHQLSDLLSRLLCHFGLLYQKQKESSNIWIDRNCQPFVVTQNSFQA